MLQAQPPPIIAPTAAASYDRRVVNLIAVIAHGPAAELDRLEVKAQSSGFVAKHANGPAGDELMVIFGPSNQPAARSFERTAPARFPRLRFESALLPSK